MIRLAEAPGFGVDSAQQMIAETGVDAETFPSAGRFSSWAGVSPGREESAEHNRSARCAKGNRFVRRLLTQAAQAAVKKKGSSFQSLFRRLLPGLGFNKAMGAIAHRLCRLVWKILHEGVSYVEQEQETDPRSRKYRADKLKKQLRALGYNVTLTPVTPGLAASQG